MARQELELSRQWDDVREARGQTLAQVSYFVDGSPRRFVLTCTRLAHDERPIDAVCDAVVRTFRIVDPGR